MADQRDDHTPETPDGDQRMTFGRVEDLAVYQRDEEVFLARASRTVPCSYCNIYWGTPEEMRIHEASHTTNGELEAIPDCTELYARALATIKREDDEIQRLKVETERNEGWRQRFSELYSKQKRIDIPKELLARIKISVLKNGEPLGVDEVKSLAQKQEEDSRFKEATSEFVDDQK